MSKDLNGCFPHTCTSRTFYTSTSVPSKELENQHRKLKQFDTEKKEKDWEADQVRLLSYAVLEHNVSQLAQSQ